MKRKTVELKQDGDGFMVASTPAVDRDRDRVLPFGASLDNYSKNPVLMFGHNYHEPWSLIGQAEDVQVSAAGIRFRPVLREPANDQDPMHIVRSLWDNKLLKAASIGFNPTKAKENEHGGHDFTEWELLEISLVPIPANQDALRLAAKALKTGDSAGVPVAQSDAEPAPVEAGAGEVLENGSQGLEGQSTAHRPVTINIVLQRPQEDPPTAGTVVSQEPMPEAGPGNPAGEVEDDLTDEEWEQIAEALAITVDAVETYIQGDEEDGD